MNKSNMNLATRLGLGFGAVLALLIIVAGVGIFSLVTLKGDIDTVVHDRFPKTMQANQIIEAYNDVARATFAALLVKDPQQIKKELDRIPPARVQITKNMDLLEGSIESEEGKKKFSKLVAARAKYVQLLEEYLKLQGENEQAKATELRMGTLRTAGNEYLAVINELIDFQTELMIKDGTKAESAAKSANWIIIIVTILASVVAIIITLVIIRKIMAQLGGDPDYAANVVKTIASGDLSSTIVIKSSDTGSLLFAMKSMQENLCQTISQIRDSVETINTASKEIAAGNSDLSQRTEEQASSLEETASSIEELTSTVKQNAENAGHANQLARNASVIAIKGGEVVGNVVGTMNGINDASRKIVDIISVIDGIAFQTNILALNAAVEAARAGEQGRGFAVVAGEVRNLAQRSAAAAKEIKLLINDTVERVDGGTKQVEEAGQTMSEIVSSVQRVTEIIGEISNASTEQSTGIEQVNQAIAQMDQVTQQNAALVEEAAAAAESLEDQAQNLAEAISVFKINAVPGQHAVVTARSAARSHSQTPALPSGSKPKQAVKKAAAKPKALPADEGDEWKEF